MQNIPNKTDGVDTLPATDFNSHKNELQALVTESGQTLAIGTTDQLRKAISTFSRGLYCADSSGAANTLTLARPTALTDANAYFDGMTLFFDTPNANTGATTVTVNGLASKKVRTAADADIVAGDILAGTAYMLVYNAALDSAAGAFELKNIVGSTSVSSLSGVRQTVQFSSIDANGQPNFITAGVGLSVDIAATTIPVVIHASGGSPSNDRVGTISADTSIAGLTDATTNYLYADVAVDGTVTLSANTVLHIEQPGGTPAVTNNLLTFNYGEMIGYLGDGGTAPQSWRVPIGEAVTAGGVVTSVVNYALNGRYRSPNTAIPALSTVTNFAPNIGTIHNNHYAYFVCLSAEFGYAIGDIVRAANTAAGTQLFGQFVWANGRNAVKTITGSAFTGILAMDATTGTVTNLTALSWNQFIIVERSF